MLEALHERLRLAGSARNDQDGIVARQRPDDTGQARPVDGQAEQGGLAGPGPHHHELLQPHYHRPHHH